jgi:lipopolysaccharide export system protein LptA
MPNNGPDAGNCIMRSFVLIITTTAVLFAAFLVYARLASPPHRDAQQAAAATVPVAAPRGNSNQTYATGAWSNLYDKDGQLYGRLRSRECIPRSDGQWHLTEPEAEFYQSDGQIVDLTANDGDVVLGQQTHRQDLLSGPVDPPSQGTLRDVTVTLYSGAAALQQHKPDMTIRMNNTHFDADTYRLYTVAQTDASGRTVPAALVPVTMTSRDADFDGTGMLLDWNGQTHVLKSLTIAHGRRLRLHSQPAAPATQEAAGKTKGAQTQPADLHTYLALFNGGVRVVQSGQDKIRSDQMLVTMSTGHEAQTRIVSTSSSSDTTDADASPKDSEPLDVFWGGTLRVIPASPATVLKPGESIVRFTGNAVRVRDDSMTLVGTDVQYDNSSGIAVAAGSAAQPLHISFLDHDGTVTGTVIAVQAQYFQQTQHVIFNGSGKGTFADPDNADSSMRVAWGRSCNLTLAGTGNQLQIQQADMIGNASVIDGPSDGPAKLRLTAGLIHTLFEPAATAAPTAADANHSSAVLRDMVAIGDAHCLIHNESGSDRALAGDKLTVEMGKDSAGKAFPKYITSEGRVHAQQEKQELWSDRLDATVAPATRPTGSRKAAADDSSQFQLQTMLATGNVQVRNAQGSTAKGDTLSVDEPNNQPFVTLIGKPFATVTGSNRSMQGPKIELKPDEDWALATGPGQIDGLTAATASGSSQPMHAHWNGTATVLGPQNQIDILGGVQADSMEANGTKNTANADHAILYLAPRPPAPTAVKKDPSNTPQFSMLKDKQIQTVSLRKNASVESTLLAADDSILRRAFIEGDEIDHDIPAQRLTVPGPGRMLIEEHTKPGAATRPSNSGEQSPAGGQGISAFSWTKKFTFDQATRQAVIDGNVQIRHQPDGKTSKPTALAADHVTADFLPAQGGSKKSAAASAGQEQLQLKKMTATGHVLVHDGDKLIQADEVSYDPITEILTAGGADDDLVIVTDMKTGGEETFQEAEINTRTNQFTATNVSGHARR